MITVSHDRYFLDRICDKVFVFQGDHTLKEYPGGYSDYIAKQQENMTQQKVKSAAKSWKDQTIPKFTSKEKKEFETIDDCLEQLQQQIKELDEEMNEAGNDFALLDALSKQRSQLEEELDAMTMRWMELQEKYQLIQSYRNQS